MKKNPIFFLVAFIFLLMPVCVLAGTFGLKIDRAVFFADVVPGNSYDFKFNVENDSDFPKVVKIYARDYEVRENNEIFLLEKNDSNIGISDWVKLEAREIVLQPKEKTEVRFILEVPPNASIGSHHGAIFVEMFSDQKEGDEFSKSSLSGRVGVHILANVGGETNGMGEILNFKNTFFFWKKINFFVTFENKGNTHYVPRGSIFIKNIFSKKEEKIDLNKRVVFPGKKYFFQKEWSGGSVLGVYMARVVFVDGNGEALMKTRYFFGALFFPVILAVFAVITLVIRKLKKGKIGGN